MFRKLRTVIYNVPDLNAAKQWYAKATGIDPYFDQPFYVGFDINGCELGLDPDMSNVKPGNSSTAYWAVENIEERVTWLEEAGASVTSPITEVGGGIKVATISDPWGNAVGLIEEKG